MRTDLAYGGVLLYEESAKTLRTDQGSFQKTAASFVIHSVLVSLLFILKSPNIAFDNFTVGIASPVAAKEQESRNRKQRLKHSHLAKSYTNHKATCQHAVIAQTIHIFVFTPFTVNLHCDVLHNPCRQCTIILFRIISTTISRLCLS